MYGPNNLSCPLSYQLRLPALTIPSWWVRLVVTGVEWAPHGLVVLTLALQVDVPEPAGAWESKSPITEQETCCLVPAGGLFPAHIGPLAPALVVPQSFTVEVIGRLG